MGGCGLLRALISIEVEKSQFWDLVYRLITTLYTYTGRQTERERERLQENPRETLGRNGERPGREVDLILDSEQTHDRSSVCPSFSLVGKNKQKKKRLFTRGTTFVQKKMAVMPFALFFWEGGGAF